MLINMNSRNARLREFSARRERFRDISESIECYNELGELSRVYYLQIRDVREVRGCTIL